MSIILKSATPKNLPFLMFLYDSIRQASQSVVERDIDDGFVRQNIEGRGLISTFVEWEGVRCFFDLSDHAFLWNLDALEECDVYFKANLHWGIAEKYLGQKLFHECKGRIAPFLLFAPDLKRISRQRALYKSLSLFQSFDVCQIVGVYRNHIKLNENGQQIRGIRSGLTPDEYHFWIRYLTHLQLKEGAAAAFTRLTSKGKKGNEDGLVIYPPVRKPLFFQKLSASKFQFVNIMPHALLPWKATEGLALDTPMVLDHDPLMEMPVGFELVQGEHYLSLLGKRFDFDLTGICSAEEPKQYRILNEISESEWAEAFETLEAQLRSKEVYERMKAAVIKYRTQKLTAENLCNTIRYYIKICSND